MVWCSVAPPLGKDVFESTQQRNSRTNQWQTFQNWPNTCLDASGIFFASKLQYDMDENLAISTTPRKMVDFKCWGFFGRVSGQNMFLNSKTHTKTLWSEILWARWFVLVFFHSTMLRTKWRVNPKGIANSTPTAYCTYIWGRLPRLACHSCQKPGLYFVLF